MHSENCCSSQRRKKIPKTNQQKLNERNTWYFKTIRCECIVKSIEIKRKWYYGVRNARGTWRNVWSKKEKQKLHAVHLMYSHNHISKMIFPSTLGIVVGFHFIFSIILWCICDNTVCRCRAPYTSIKCERNFEKTGSSLKSFVVHLMHNAQHSTTQRHTHTHQPRDERPLHFHVPYCAIAALTNV